MNNSVTSLPVALGRVQYSVVAIDVDVAVDTVAVGIVAVVVDMVAVVVALVDTSGEGNRPAAVAGLQVDE